MYCIRCCDSGKLVSSFIGNKIYWRDCPDCNGIEKQIRENLRIERTVKIKTKKS